MRHDGAVHHNIRSNKNYASIHLEFIKFINKFWAGSLKSDSNCSNYLPAFNVF